MPGVHYLPVDTVEDVPEAIRRLQAEMGRETGWLGG